MKKPLLLITIFSALLYVVFPLLAQELRQETGNETAAILPEDTLMLGYSTDVLLSIRAQYQRDMEKLLHRKDRLRARGIRDMERFIARHQNSPVLDKILIRLAGLYFEQAQKDYAADVAAYQDRLSNADQVAIGASSEFDEPEPLIDYSSAVELYQRVIDEFASGSFIEDALYNKAFLLEDQGERREAAETYQLLAVMFPESHYTPDALMRVAEYHFAPPLRDFDTAIAHFEQVLKFKESPLYDAALYRLGWAYYKLSDYPSAISYFTLLADDIGRVKKLDPGARHHLPAVRDEAIEYIGISFLDFGGAREAAFYFEQIGGRGYGYDVFKKIGDAYMEVKEEYRQAIQSYEFLLAMYPEHQQAPYIQAKIAQAYRHLEDDKMAFASRKKLFTNYGANGQWGKNLPKIYQDKGQQLAKRSLRKNINYLLKIAEQKNDPTQYSRFVEESRAYLKAFPLDSNAVQIHWNLALTLDMKLAASEEAFNEYVKISNIYTGNSVQKQAAKNAIAIADEQLKQHAAQQADSTITAPGVQKLSRQEERMVLALDNYIRNFPHDETTPGMLAQAGSIYYKKGQFRQSIRYFKTLARHFPESPESNHARFITMESYFGKGDLKSTELIAKKIRDAGTGYNGQADQRLAEAVFMQAKSAADSAEHLFAADEYLRVVTEVPDAKFADLALYNAALEYEKVNRFDSAISTYQRLLGNYPETEHRLDALTNLAFDLREIEDFRGAGLTYQRLATAAPTDSIARIALYNASISFVQAKEWRHAISTNNSYAERFPLDDVAVDLLYDNAAHYLQLDDQVSADEIYERFARQFPNSPKVIASYFHRGEYLKNIGRPEEAHEQFALAVRKAETLKTDNVQINDFIVAEALFQLTELDFTVFEKIRFVGNIKENKAHKKQLLVQITDNYARVINFGTARLPEATFKIGRAYEEFAATWAGQEISQTDINQRIVARNNLNRTAARLYEKAVEAYRNGAGALSRFLEKQNAKPESETHIAANGKVSIADSSLQLTVSWMNKCREKVPETLFTVARLHQVSLQELLDAPAPDGVSELEELVYQYEVLKKVVAPLVKQVIEIHQRIFAESDTLFFNKDWVIRSRTAVIAARNLIPDETDRLSRAAQSAFVDLLPVFEHAIEAGENSALDIAERIPALLELSAALAKASADGFRQNLENVVNVENSSDSLFVIETEERLMQSIFSYAKQSGVLAKVADERRRHFETRFNKTGKVLYEDAYLTFDDAYFALDDGSHQMMKYGFAASLYIKEKEHWRRKTGLALIRRHPEEYSRKLGLTIDSKFEASSSNWLASANFHKNWMSPDFNDGTWSFADEKAVSPRLGGDIVRSIWYSDSLEENSEIVTAEPDTRIIADLFIPDTVFFRKTFDINGLSVAASMQVYFENKLFVYVNGHEIEPDEEVDSGKILMYDLTQQLKTGRNVLAVRAENENGLPVGFESLVEIKFISDWSALLEDRINMTETKSKKKRSEGKVTE